MKKIKRFYREHRVFTILMAVVIVCFILIGTLLFQCFYSGGSDKYGDRLEDISKYEIKKEKMEEIETKIITDDKVKTADVFRTGKIIYAIIEFEPATELMEAQNINIAKNIEEIIIFFDIFIPPFFRYFRYFCTIFCISSLTHFTCLSEDTLTLIL